LGAAAQDLLRRLAADAPVAVIDTFVHHDRKHRLLELPGALLEVHCACPPDLARRRYTARRRHPCHLDTQLLADAWDRWVREDARPLALGGPVLEVDTTRAADIAAIAAWVTDPVRR
jgi:hypothetical protein